MFCRECGKELEAESQFCPECGAEQRRVDDNARATSERGEACDPVCSVKNIDSGAKASRKRRATITALAIVVAVIAITAAAAMTWLAPSGSEQETNQGQMETEHDEEAAQEKIRADAVYDGALDQAVEGDTVCLGSYEQDNNKSNGSEKIEWKVLAVKGGKALLISRYCLDARPFNANGFDDRWNSSDLKAWLAGEFAKKAFSSKEKEKVAGKPFCLSRKEARKYFKDDDDRVSEPTAYAIARGVATYGSDVCSWWLRSPAPGKEYGLGDGVDQLGWLSDEHGALRYDLDDSSLGVRPAIWINL